MSVKAAAWVNELDCMGVFADRASLEAMLAKAPDDIEAKPHVDALRAHLSAGA